MLIVISPAKSLDFEASPISEVHTTPEFLEDSQLLIKKLKKLSPKKIGKLMSISPALSDLNYERYQTWNLPFDTNNSKQCLEAFRGDVYRGMAAETFTQEDFNYSQKHLRILSGLYGLLKPLDLIQPYRLEMGTRFAVTPKKSNLYKFWDTKITEAVNKAVAESGNNILINLASNEYYKAVQPKLVEGTIITPQFKDMKNGEYKAIMTFAKLARGYMSAFIIKNRLTEPEQLKAFDTEGYVYNENESEGNDWVFTRG
jgi:cytoplasmic iron level regulating protein YaaA (DUF328/UPF0246 family)